MSGNISEYFWEPPDKSFSPLMMKAYGNSEAAEHKYRIYKSASEFEDVEAMYASEAIEKSGIEEPVKVERVGLKFDSYIIPEGQIKASEGKVEQKEEVQADDVATAVEAPEKPEEVSVTEATASEQ